MYKRKLQNVDKKPLAILQYNERLKIRTSNERGSGTPDAGAELRILPCLGGAREPFHLRPYSFRNHRLCLGTDEVELRSCIVVIVVITQP